MIIICSANINANDLLIRIIIKCKWLLFDYDLQMLMIIKCKWFANANDY